MQFLFFLVFLIKPSNQLKCGNWCIFTTCQSCFDDVDRAFSVLFCTAIFCTTHVYRIKRLVKIENSNLFKISERLGGVFPFSKIRMAQEATIVIIARGMCSFCRISRWCLKYKKLIQLSLDRATVYLKNELTRALLRRLSLKN